MHRGQRREVDGAPFIVHPLEVASLLYFVGAPDTVVAAGVLHDVIEDTDAAAGDLRRASATVTKLVLAVSEDDGIDDFDARKAALREQVAAAGEDALLLFAADKVSKVWSCVWPASAACSTTRLRRRLDHYRRSLDLLDELRGRHPSGAAPGPGARPARRAAAARARS